MAHRPGAAEGRPEPAAAGVHDVRPPLHAAPAVAVPALGGPGVAAVAASPSGARLYRSVIQQVQATAGNRAAAQRVTALRPVVQRDPDKPVDPRFTNDPIGTAIAQAKQKFPQYASKLAQIRFRAVTRGDRTEVHVEGQGQFVYPSQIGRADEGFYAIEWDAAGNSVRNGVINLETGQPPSTMPDVRALAGGAEAAELRKLRFGVFWITQTVVTPPRRPDPTPDQLEVPLSSEVSQEELNRTIEEQGRKKLSIPGITGGVFDPKYAYGKPLNFTFETHDGTDVYVTRKLVGRDFHYRLGIGELQNYLKFYPFEYAGLSAKGWEPLARLIFEIGLGFVPIIGPLWALYQAADTAHNLYKNWDKLSGFEKGLGGLTILLSVVPVIKTGRSIARGASAYKEGVGSLVAAGLPKKEASRLMLASGIFQSEKATLQVVDTLGDALRRGERLTASQLTQLEGVFMKMLQRLPTAERVAIEASFATADLRAAKDFFTGIELTEKHLAGLRRLSPEVLVALRTAAAKEPILVERAALWASSSQDIANGINHLQGAVKPAHLAAVVSEAGEDVLRRIGEYGGLSDALAKFVGKARSSAEAYRRLMAGSAKLKLPGLSQALAAAERTPLSAELSAIRKQFEHTYLSPEQLHALSKLAPATRAMFAKASDAQLRIVAGAIDASSAAVTGVEALALQLGAKASQRLLPDIVERLGSGVLDAAGKHGAKLSADLVAKVAAQSSPRKAVDLLLTGYKVRGGPRVAGLLDEIAAKLPNATTAEAVLAKIERPGLRAETFARWALRNPGQLRAVSPKVADGVDAIAALRPATAQKHLSDLYRAFAGDRAVVYDFLQSIGNIHTKQPNVANLDRLVAEVAAGGTKSMGASLTLSFATRRVSTITAFEQKVTTALGGREYDLVADSISFEFKYWRGFGGRPATAAAREFAKDVVLHAGENFSRLRWVISKDAVGYLPAIESMMRGVLTRREVRAELAKLGITVAQAQDRLAAALKSGLIEMF